MTRASWALIVAGFRRYATYRQATWAGVFTNSVFGFLRCYVMLAVAAAAGGTIGGYSGPQLVAYVWIAQGMLAVVNVWEQLDLADRVRSGDVVADLLRPVNPLWTYMLTDVGRAGFALLNRFAVPVAVGAIAFEFYEPRDWWTYPLFAVSMVLAVLVSFVCRFLIGLTAFWLLDIRGVTVVWLFSSAAASGLYFPLAILPDWARTALWLGTPFPSLLQGPTDVLVERGHTPFVLAAQVLWLVALLLLCRRVQRAAERKLVVQGG